MKEPTTRAPSEGGTGAARTLLRGGRLVGGARMELALQGGRVVAMAERIAPAAEDTLIDLEGMTLVPAFIDSHVHLAYYPVESQLLSAGVAGVVDLASPFSFLDALPAGMRIVAAGPMVTKVGGYPTRGWGRDGYGLECASASDVEEGIDTLYARGARIVKIPLDGAPVFDDATLARAVTRAHAHGMKVAVHAVSDASARRAGLARADLLAHTPVEPLSEDTLAAWRGRAVVSTLRAFGGATTTLANLRRLREAGAVILYGTDLGNTRTPGIDAAELAMLGMAGLDPEAILEAATSAPAAYFGIEDLGALAVGKAASFLVVERDPSAEIAVLSRPIAVYIDGVRR